MNSISAQIPTSRPVMYLYSPTLYFSTAIVLTPIGNILADVGSMSIYIYKRRIRAHDWPTPLLIILVTSSVPIRSSLEG